MLRLLATGGPRGAADIARSLGLAKATGYGIIRTLADLGFVEQDKGTGRYQLGAALLHLGTCYLDGNELRARSINWADPLAARSGESVRVGTLAEGEGKVLVVHHVFRPDDSLQTLDVGNLLPLHATALGKVILAYAPPDVAAKVLRGELSTYTRRTLSRPQLAKSLDETRETGWAAEVEEMILGKAAIAAAIRGHGGLVLGAIGISGAVEHICDSAGHPNRSLVTYVCDAARAISRDLGAPRS